MSYVFCTPIKIDELNALKIEHPRFSATLLLQGAQLIEFSPSDDKLPSNPNVNNLIWLSDTAEFKKGQSVRGGIPICWPWFGDINKNPECIKQQVGNSNSLPAHGFVRNLEWCIANIEENCQFVIIDLDISSTQETLKIWPFSFNLRARFKFSQQLEVELITTNMSDGDMHFSQALHTYLPTTDIHTTYIHHTDRARYIDALDNWQMKEEVGRISFKQETDRLYFFKTTNNDYELRVETPDRQLLLYNENTTSAVIWNPWIEKSLRLSQFDAEDYKTMFCIETASVLEDAKQVASQKCDRIAMILKTL